MDLALTSYIILSLVIILICDEITSISENALGPLNVSEQQLELDPPVPHSYSQFRLGSTPMQLPKHSGYVDLHCTSWRKKKDIHLYVFVFLARYLKL